MQQVSQFPYNEFNSFLIPSVEVEPEIGVGKVPEVISECGLGFCFWKLGICMESV